MKERKLDYSKLESLAKGADIVWMDVPYALEDFEDAMEHEMEIHPDFTDAQIALIARDHLNAYGAEYCERMKQIERMLDY